VKAIMAGMGYAVMGTATASGQDRSIEAAQRAIASPLLEAGAIDGARGILINITGSSNLRLAEVNEASTIIQSAAHEDANIIFGAVLDEKMKDDIKITVIATGFKDYPARRHDRFSAAAAAVSHSRTAPTYTPPTINLPPAVATAPDSKPEPEPMAPSVEAHPAPRRDTASLEQVTSAVKASYEQDDLDVPAFLRKRGDVH
jgi:cell division protein FtsZ